MTVIGALSSLREPGEMSRHKRPSVYEIEGTQPREVNLPRRGRRHERRHRSQLLQLRQCE